MKYKIRSYTLVFVFGVAALFTACGGGKVVVVPPQATTPTAVVPEALVPGGTVVATMPEMPAPPAEESVIAASPGAAYVWVKGCYNWDGARYLWTPGAWVQTPRPNAVWVAGHWQPTNGGYVWVSGFWR
jgi:hypothetical protein